MSFNFPFTESIILYIGLTVIVLGILMILMLIYQRVNRYYKEQKAMPAKPEKPKEEKKKTEPGCAILMLRLFLILFLVILGLLLMFFGAFIQSLTSFSKEELVAEVKFEDFNDVNHWMRLVLLEKKGSSANVPQHFLILGDQWFIRGDIVKWDSWVNWLGLNTQYKLTRIGGFFTNPKDEAEQKSTHYSLVPEEETSKWRWLYKNGYKLPFISDVYGNSVYKYPEMNKVFKVYVTPSGFSIGTEEE